MRYEMALEDGGMLFFECSPDESARRLHGAVLAGRTHPHLPFIGDVDVAFDIGAGCGSTALVLARHHPQAQIHAFEPRRDLRQHLERNVDGLANVHVHDCDLAAVAGWAAAQGIERVDVLKVDAADDEVRVLESLVGLVAAAKVLYVEYASRHGRRAAEVLALPTHELLRALTALDQGEVIYLHQDLADHPSVRPRLLELFSAAATSS